MEENQWCLGAGMGSLVVVVKNRTHYVFQRFGYACDFTVYVLLESSK